MNIIISTGAHFWIDVSSYSAYRFYNHVPSKVNMPWYGVDSMILVKVE